MKLKDTERLDRTGRLVVQCRGARDTPRRHWTDGSGRTLCGAKAGHFIDGAVAGTQCKRCERSLA